VSVFILGFFIFATLFQMKSSQRVHCYCCFAGGAKSVQRVFSLIDNNAYKKLIARNPTAAHVKPNNVLLSALSLQ
jgi:hypothetical protein